MIYTFDTWIECKWCHRYLLWIKLYLRTSHVTLSAIVHFSDGNFLIVLSLLSIAFPTTWLGATRFLAHVQHTLRPLCLLLPTSRGLLGKSRRYHCPQRAAAYLLTKTSGPCSSNRIQQVDRYHNNLSTGTQTNIL